jgi:hypothetical protein
LWGFAHDPKFSLCHAPSLRRPCWRSTPVDFKRHHYPEVASRFALPIAIRQAPGAAENRYPV